MEMSPLEYVIGLLLERVCMDIPSEVEGLQKLERIRTHFGYQHRRKIVEEFCSNFNPDTTIENEQLADKMFKEIYCNLDSNN
ncbi:MAG: hypothetical protein F4Z71_03255 [Gammaproteobacteria bacterium]|nr:hypothetical protein [Gammaproteobacteria bacterium]MYE28986.1 hypothetical protein [Gammaproteobacteria bacterium]